MGTSKRLEPYYDKLYMQRVYEQAMTEHLPDSLSRPEIDLEHEALTIPPHPRAVTAWVRYGITPVRVDGWAYRWTGNAVAIAWRTHDSRVHKAWVWWPAARWRTARDVESAPELPKHNVEAPRNAKKRPDDLPK